jgi:hypothetical protein
MSSGLGDYWKRRRKRWSRRFARDVRMALPALWVLCCFSSAATTILAAERIPLPGAKAVMGDRWLDELQARAPGIGIPEDPEISAGGSPAEATVLGGSLEVSEASPSGPTEPVGTPLGDGLLMAAATPRSR